VEFGRFFEIVRKKKWGGGEKSHFRRNYKKAHEIKSIPKKIGDGRKKENMRALEQKQTQQQQQEEEGVLHWLLEKGQPIVRYYTLIDLLGKSKKEEEVKEAYSDITKRGWAYDILKEQKPGGYWESKEDLYTPKYLATNWKSIVLSDFGLTKQDKRIEETAELFFKEWLGGKGEENNVLSDGEVCIVGNLARFLTRFGYADDPRVKKLFDWLVNDQKQDGGWHCFKSDKGTLDCWEALAAFASLPREKWTKGIKNSVERGAEFYLGRELFREGKRYGPWFRFHYPTHYYYDLLVGLDTITALGYASDKRLKPALKIMEEKRLSDGTWALDAVHPDVGPGADYTFRRQPIPFALEEKGKSSKWITLIALRVMKRVQGY
jgi:hypothetical protein